MGHSGARTVAYSGRHGLIPRRIPRWILSLAVLGLLGAVVFAFGTSFLQVYRLKREAARLLQLKQDLIEQNAQLREEIKLLHTPGYIERIAREQLGLVKPGEIALLIVRPKLENPPAVEPKHVIKAKPSWATRTWRALRRRLFGQ